MSRMKKWLLRGLMILAGLAVLLAGLVALQPADYSVERSITIRSGPGPVFAQLETLKAWDHWNPSTKLDPTRGWSSQARRQARVRRWPGGAMLKWVRGR